MNVNSHDSNVCRIARYVSAWRDYWDRFEAIVGLIAVFGLAFGPLTIAALNLIFALLLAEWRGAAIAAIITAVTAPMAIWLARMAETALAEFRMRQAPRIESSADDADPGQRWPFAILMAQTLPPLPWLARIPVAAWWLAHFLAATALVQFGEVLAQHGQIWAGIAEGIPAVVFGYVFHFAANVFLVLAVAALLGSSNATKAIWRKRFVIDGVVVLLGIHSPAMSWAKDPAAPTPSEERLELMHRVFSEFKLQFAEKPEQSLPHTKQPILRWSNPIRESFSDGAGYLWLKDERPVAMAAISIQGKRGVWREFSTLSTEPLKATQDGQVVWNPKGGDLVRKVLKEAPAPAKAARLRLSQMRKIAEQFQVTMFESEFKRDEFKQLRLLPQPVYQWSLKSPGVSEGAVFAFCESTDPEAVLVLELSSDKTEDPPQWRYSLARMTSRPLTFFHKDQEIGSVKGYWANPRTRQDPYAARREAPFEPDKASP